MSKWKFSRASTRKILAAVAQTDINSLEESKFNQALRQYKSRWLRVRVLLQAIQKQK
jgi:hypothetical protein